MIKYVLMTPWCPANKLEWYSVMILSMHASGTARTAVSFSGLTLNNNESSRTHFSASASTLLIAALEEGSLFCDKYKYKSLKYELCKYPVCISFISTGKWVPFNTFLRILFNILSMSVLASIYELNSLCLWGSQILLVLGKNDLSSLWNVLDMMPSWNGEFSSESKFRLILSISVELCELWGYDTSCLMSLGSGL